MYRIAAALFSFLVAAACTSNPQAVDRVAHSAGLTRTTIAGADFWHIVYTNAAAIGPATAANRRLFVFFEGDGRPWAWDQEERKPSADPTTRNPVALKLLTRTRHAAAYISRPCYQGMRGALCSADTWTSARYSPGVVASMTSAVRTVGAQAGTEEIVLIGYSGGGALAVLVAERIENVAAVVTIAANLDTDAWSQHHRYLPLTGSLNPATSEREHPWPELHLVGAQDSVVPSATTSAYFKRYPAAKQRSFERYDHVCCWEEDWRSILVRIEEDARVATKKDQKKE